MESWGDDIKVDHHSNKTTQQNSQNQQSKQYEESDFTPTEEELNSISLAAQRLWNIDDDCLTPYKDYEIDLQGGKKVYQTEDNAHYPLFKSVSKNVFAIPQYKSFHNLLDNYSNRTGIQEVVTKEEIRENQQFINEIMKTRCIKYLHKYLVHHNKASQNIDEFKMQLSQLWFDLYSRDSKNDSSGFEHVFVGEIRQGKVIGFHNWIQLYIQEQQGKANYKGWIKPKKYRSLQNDTPDGYDQLVTVQFDWENHSKQVSSSFIGSSPGFEVALYTMCFLCGYEDNYIEIGDYNVNIKCFTFKTTQGNKLGTSYPEIL